MKSVILCRRDFVAYRDCNHFNDYLLGALGIVNESKANKIDEVTLWVKEYEYRDENGNVVTKK